MEERQPLGATRRTLPVLVVVLLVAIAGCSATDGTSPAPGGDETATAPPTPTQLSTHGLEVHAINVGPADATLLVGPTGETMLVDSGGRGGGDTVIAYLEAYGVDRIDHLVSTHPHDDHIGGHADVIEHYEENRSGVGAVYYTGVASSSDLYEEYVAAAARYDVPLYEVRATDEIPFEGTETVVYNPPANDTFDDHNNNSVTVHVRFGEASFLFTGDAQQAAERRMAQRYGDRLDADVLHASRHGDRTGSTEPFLEAVRPQLTIISGMYDSPDGNPHAETLDRLAAHGSLVVWTAVHGTSVYGTDGREITVYTQAHRPMDPLAIRDGERIAAGPIGPVEERTTITASAAGQSNASARTAP